MLPRMSILRTLLLGACGLMPLAAAGCSDAKCDPNPVGEAWKPYESLLPDNAVVCGPNRKSAKKPSDVVDNYPPTHVFVFYQDTNAAGAFDATLKKFEAAGWKVVDLNVVGEGSSALYDGAVEKDGVKIEIGVNRNDWGTQGSFDVRAPAKP